MALDQNAGRPIVTYVRVGRGMVKVTKYENEQPKSPSDTTSLRSSRSSSGRSTSTPGPSRSWLRRPGSHKAANKRAPSAHRSRSRSSGRSLQTIRRAGGYMQSDQDLTSTERRSQESTTSSGRRGRADPQGLFALNSLPVPTRRGEQSYSRRHTSPQLSEPRGRELRISPPGISPTHTHPSHPDFTPSPSTQSWTTTDSEVDPVADTEMWSTISRLEDELVSRFGRGQVPSLTGLRNEKTSAPPQAGTGRDRTPSLPDDLAAALHRNPSTLHTQSQNVKLAQRFHESIAPPGSLSRKVHRTKSTPALAFPLPPPNLPNWVTHTPLPTPPSPSQLAYTQHDLTSSPLLRAKHSAPPPFAPPPNFPPPPPPTVRPEDRDTQKDLEALEALYEVLQAGVGYRPGTVGGVKDRPSVSAAIDRNAGHRRTTEPNGGPRRKVLSCPKPFEGRNQDVVEEEEGEVAPSGLVAHAY